MPSSPILCFCAQGEVSPCQTGSSLPPAITGVSSCLLDRMDCLLPQGGRNFSPDLVEGCRASPGRLVL